MTMKETFTLKDYAALGWIVATLTFPLTDTSIPPAKTMGEAAVIAVIKIICGTLMMLSLMQMVMCIRRKV